MSHAPVSDKTLEMINRHRFIDQDTTTAGLAKTGTDPTHGKGKGVPIHNQAQSLFILALGNVGDIALHIDLTGTGQVTGSLTVTKMGRGDDAEPFLAMSNDGIGCGLDDHTVLGKSSAGPKETFRCQG